MKVIIAGTRHMQQSLSAVTDAIRTSGFVITEIVSGCSGDVDWAGDFFACTNGIPVKRFPAEWKKYGRAAGPIRNQQMANYADALIAVWDGKSRGTADMIERAKRASLKVHILEIAT